VSIRRHVLETAKQRLVEAQADLDALLEEPDEEPTAPGAGFAEEHVGTRLHAGLRKDFSRSRHYGLELTPMQIDYLARVALDVEVTVNDTIFSLGALPAYAERLERNSHEDSTKLKEQAIEIRRLREGLVEAKAKCPVCGGAGEVQIQEFSSGDVLNRRVMQKCPAPVHSL
jgi:tRNA(Ile2) C34 agmatinyltransferase TiaS